MHVCLLVLLQPTYFIFYSLNLPTESSTSNRREFQVMGSAFGLRVDTCTGLSVQGQYRSEAEGGVGICTPPQLTCMTLSWPFLGQRKAQGSSPQ